MSNPNGGVYGSDEPRHEGSGRRLSGVMIVVEASVVVVGVGVKNRGHKDTVYALTAIGGAAAASTEGAGVVGGNEVLDERKKELRPRSNLSDSSCSGEVGNWTGDTQKKQVYSPRELEVPDQKRGRRKQEGGRKNLDL